MVVKIEMDMPKSCSECRFLYDGCLCMVDNDINDDTLELQMCYLKNTRAVGCPLQEVKECE